MAKQALSLVIAVYNVVRNLEFIFLALQRQSFKDFEVLIADDGSGPEIKNLVERVKPQVTFPIRHLWQEDSGFRKNAMLNKAILASQTDYIVFIDGDCIPHRHFLMDHAGNRGNKKVLCGRRVNLSREITGQISSETIISGAFERWSVGLLMDGLMARSANLEDAIRIESPFIRKILHQNKARILGCNFSVERSLLEAVNGFNEDYKAPGLGEDSDIAFRLEMIGGKLFTLRYLAVLYHLYHPRTVVGEANQTIYKSMIASRNPVCPNGLRKLKS